MIRRLRPAMRLFKLYVWAHRRPFACQTESLGRTDLEVRTQHGPRVRMSSNGCVWSLMNQRSNRSVRVRLQDYSPRPNLVIEYSFRIISQLFLRLIWIR